MPPPSKRKRQEVESSQVEVEPELLMDGHGGSEVGEDEADDHEMDIIATGREAVIKLERDPQLDRRASREKKNKPKKPFRSAKSFGGRDRVKSGARLLRSTSNINSTCTIISSPGSCFLCRRRADYNVTDNPHRLQLMQVNMFKDTVQKVLGNSCSLSSSSDTCEECNEIVDKVWRLQQEILLIKEDLKTIIEETVKNIRSREGKPSDNDFSASEGEGLDGGPVEVVKGETIDSDFEGDLDCFEDEEFEGVSSFVIQGETDEKKEEESSSSHKRKSRIKAKRCLRARKIEEIQVENNDQKHVGNGVLDEEEDERYSSDDSEFEYRSYRKPGSSRSPSSSTASDIRCDICNATFKTRNSRKHHIKRVHEKQLRFPCTLCDKRFFSANDLKRHGLSKHGEENIKYKCQKCGKQLPMKHRLLNHEISVCKIDHGEEFYKEHGITLLFCEVEGCLTKYTTNAKREWERHIAAHTGRKDFICSKCGATFTQNFTLKKHERDVDCTRDGYKAPIHRQSRLKRKHACSLCPLKCVTLEGLAHHQKTVHDIDPPPGVDLVEEPVVTCDVCGVTLGKDGLKSHIERVHKNTKNKSCPYCDKMFYNNSDLNVHVKRHHQERDLIVQAESFLREDDELQS